MNKRILLALGAALLLGVVSGCGTSSDQKPAGSASASAAAPRNIIVAYSLTTRPNTYQDENGNAAGYDIEVFKKIDELLPQYTFTFEGVSKDAVNVGTENGTYQIGLAGYFKNPKRLKTYLMPDTPVGASTIAVVVRDDNTTINGFEDLVKNNAKIVPVVSSSGVPGVVDAWNKEHPDSQVKLDLVSKEDKAANVRAVAGGSYDAQITLAQQYKALDEDVRKGTKLTKTVTAVPSYAIINKDEAELAKAVDEAIQKLRDDGTLAKISEKYYHEDIFQYLK